MARFDTTAWKTECESFIWYSSIRTESDAFLGVEDQRNVNVVPPRTMQDEIDWELVDCGGTSSWW